MIAVPVSIGLALFITEIAPKKLRTPVVYLIDLLAAIPSVVYGLWGILVFGPEIAKVYDDISRLLRRLPGPRGPLPRRQREKLHDRRASSWPS